MTTNTQPSALAIDFRQALARYEADPQNSATIRPLGWVYAQLLKDASGSTDSARMLRGLSVISAFPMTDDARWRESVGWSVCRFLMRHTPDTLPFPALAEVLRLSGGFVPTEAGLLRSVWWKALLRHADTGLDWTLLVAQHGWEGMFRPEDERPEAYGNGKTARPLLEGLLYAVARQLLTQVTLPDEQAQPWLDRMAHYATAHPDWTFLTYFRAQLLLRLHRPDEARQVFMPFARQKTGDFWVWNLMADLVEPSQRLACLARALTVGAPDKMLVKVRQRAAMYLLMVGRPADARAEVEQLVQTRQANSWPIPAEVLGWQRDPRYVEATPTAPGAWARALSPEADALLFADLPETVVLVTGVDPAGHYANIAIDERLTGSFPVRKFGLTLALGDRVAIRYVPTERNGRPQVRVLQARLVADEVLTYLSIREVAGPLRMLPGKAVGFVRDVYVPADLLAGVGADMLVRVEAVQAWDAGKQKSGWRAFRIQKEPVNL
ncbi:DUF7017 domain-containing protein [Rudanella lutea]|uniref:DUF7017 domain-containing protein n=1 Tax=Rudanella lutea TaxID=451374 RepID=UPI000381AE30|nr:hypothetical protein [Rudanella lutea]